MSGFSSVGVSFTPVLYCAVCGKPVSLVQRFTTQVETGQQVLADPRFKPESQYWYGAPDQWELVFCGPECSEKYHHEHTV